MYLRHLTALLSLLMVSSVPAYAANEKTTPPPAGAGVTTITFKNSKGDVQFSHAKHVQAMGKESCIPCHRTPSPTKSDIKARFDERIAHYFCKGCHREKGQGPIECYECHKIKK